MLAVIKPVKGLLEGIFDFIKKVIIGRVLIKIIEWFADPDNKGKIEAIGAFFKNTCLHCLQHTYYLEIVLLVLLRRCCSRWASSSKINRTVIPALVGGDKTIWSCKSARLLSVVGGTALLANRLMDGGEDDVDLTKVKTVLLHRRW